MTLSLASTEIIYPDSDGQPMADNTLQFRWIVLLKENLDCIFANDPNVFVAGDLLWYPVEGHPEIRIAPDVFVVFGRPKGDRGSYRQWQEANIAPQVVFEILSPGNTVKEMRKKRQFYESYGVTEYYLYDPDENDLEIYLRQGEKLVAQEISQSWQSPLLTIQFVLTPETLEVYSAQGNPFLTTVEFNEQMQQERQRANLEQQRATLEQQRAEQERQRADAEKQRADRLLAQLRALGIPPEESFGEPTP